MGEAFFSEVTEPIRFEGLDSTNSLAFKVYESDRLVLGKRMVDHLRPGVCFWHSYAWAGVDMFGIGTLDRPWIGSPGDEMDAARQKMAVAFEFFTKLGVPYYCFHDRDVAPEGGTFASFRDNLDALADDAADYQGHGESVHAPALPGRRSHEPRSGGLRVRGRPGQAHAGGDPAAGRRELRPVGRA